MARKLQVPAVATADGKGSLQPNSPAPENGFKDELDKKIGPLVPQQARGEIVGRVYQMLVSENFSGPMPHPRHLREYEDILPGCAERMLRMAETALAHNAGMDVRIVHGEHDDRKRGMRFGLTAFMLLVLFAGLFGYLDKPIVSATFLGSAALGGIAVFVKGRLNKE